MVPPLSYNKKETKSVHKFPSTILGKNGLKPGALGKNLVKTRTGWWSLNPMPISERRFQAERARLLWTCSRDSIRIEQSNYAAPAFFLAPLTALSLWGSGEVLQTKLLFIMVSPHKWQPSTSTHHKWILKPQIQIANSDVNSLTSIPKTSVGNFKLQSNMIDWFDTLYLPNVTIALYSLRHIWPNSFARIWFLTCGHKVR